MTESQKLDRAIGRLSYWYGVTDNAHEREAIGRAIDKLLARQRELRAPRIRWRNRIAWK